MINFNQLNRYLLPILCLVFFFTLTSAKRASNKKPIPLSSIHIIDRNGFAETISAKDRLSQFQNVDFLKSQPYQKVLRIYQRDLKGDLRSIVTTYHENGNIKQFLEILNARANGIYREWHENGNLRISAQVIGGIADVGTKAEHSWLFDGVSRAWNEDSKLIAEINYSQGSLEGTALYYHASGQLWKKIPYQKNQVNGSVEIYLKDGTLLQQLAFVDGVQQGVAYRYWSPQQLASQEEYRNGKLQNAQYYSSEGEVISEVKSGNGFRVIFSKDGVNELHEYQNGENEGEVKLFHPSGSLKRLYRIKSGIKNGEEIEYFETSCQQTPQPHLAFYWVDGKIQGNVKTWYPNGALESQREISNNTKNGIATAWYRDGNLMLIEEYQNNKLIKGEYFQKGERSACSQVIQGKGTVTIFDPSGHYIQKITYIEGSPELR